WTNLRWLRSASEYLRKGRSRKMASSDGKGDHPEVKPNEDGTPAEGVEMPEQPAESQAPEGAEVVPEEEEPQPGRFARLAKHLSRPSEPSREAKSGERTRGLVILAGTTIACLFLFFGLFTTDSATTRKERK